MKSKQISNKKLKPCHHCDGQGYILIRDCTGEIQREETCSFCRGTGELTINN